MIARHATLLTTRLVTLSVLAGCGQGHPVPAPQAAPPPPTPTQDTLGAVHRRGLLRVCSTGDYRPFTYHDPRSGVWSGIDIDMAQDMAQQLGVPMQVVPTTWATMVQDLNTGHCNITMGGISVTPDRAAQATFSEPYLQDGKAPITRCADVDLFQTLAQIDQPSVRVVVNPGGTNDSYDRETLKQANIVTYPDNNTIFNELVDNHADVMLTDASETRWQATQHPGQLCAVHPDHPFTVEPKAYLLPRGDTVFQQWVNGWLQSSLTNGTYRRASRPWIG